MNYSNKYELVKYAALQEGHTKESFLKGLGNVAKMGLLATPLAGLTTGRGREALGETWKGLKGAWTGEGDVGLGHAAKNMWNFGVSPYTAAWDKGKGLLNKGKDAYATGKYMNNQRVGQQELARQNAALAERYGPGHTVNGPPSTAPQNQAAPGGTAAQPWKPPTMEQIYGLGPVEDNFPTAPAGEGPVPGGTAAQPWKPNPQPMSNESKEWLSNFSQMNFSPANSNQYQPFSGQFNKIQDVDGVPHVFGKGGVGGPDHKWKAPQSLFANNFRPTDQRQFAQQAPAGWQGG